MKLMFYKLGPIFIILDKDFLLHVRVCSWTENAAK